MTLCSDAVDGLSEPSLRIPGVAEAGVPHVDAGIDDGDLHAFAGALRDRRRQLPRLPRVDQSQVRVVVRRGAVASLVFGVQDLWRRADRGEAGAVELNGDGIECHIEFLVTRARGVVSAEPLLKSFRSAGRRSMGRNAVLEKSLFWTWRSVVRRLQAERL